MKKVFCTDVTENEEKSANKIMMIIITIAVLICMGAILFNDRAADPLAWVSALLLAFIILVCGNLHNE